MNLHSSSVADSGAYTDLNRLHQLKVGEGRDSEANIRKVAQEFESLFLSEMMKAMRAAGDVLGKCPKCLTVFPIKRRNGFLGSLPEQFYDLLVFHGITSLPFTNILRYEKKKLHIFLIFF